MTRNKYTCPMHPEVTSKKPGSCPKCGMGLVVIRDKKDETREDKKSLTQEKFKSHLGHHEGMPAPRSHAMHGEVGDTMEHHQMMMEDFKRRFFVVLPLTVIVLFLSPKIQEWFGFSLTFPLKNLVLFALGTAIAWYGGLPFYQAAKGELKTKNYGMMTLVSLAVLSGYFFSVAATFIFPGESLWWEISTLVLAFLFGHWMEMRAVIGTGGALRELAKLIPPSAHKIVGSKLKDVETSELKKGDLVLVKPGEKAPADGVVLEGESSVNEAMITGESKPVEKRVDSEVIGGTINGEGSLTIKVTKTGAESALSQIMNLVRQAQETKPNVQKLADKAANWLTITAIVVGSLTFSYWTFINPQPGGLVFAATLAITVIVIACPHALGLAIPTVTTITSALAARSGILIRDMKGLEIARRLDYIVLDKTGTLTEGKFGISRIITDKSADELGLLQLAASVEIHSQHSIAQGIVEEARAKGVKFEPAKNFKSYPGKGAEGTVGNSKVVVGNWKLVIEIGRASPKAKPAVRNSKIEEEKSLGTVVYVMKDGEHVGTMVLEDRIRPESKKATDELHRMGIKVAMLTGDKKEIAEKVGEELGIDAVFAEVLPEYKVTKVRELQGQGHIVGMVGDGVNDAPSLTQAHVGIAIGAGTDVAIESAEIVLVKSSPLDIVKAISLSKKVDFKMKQNLAWATGYNALAIPAAAGVFYPWGITLRPEWGALLMSASSIIVVANALLLKRVKL